MLTFTVDSPPTNSTHRYTAGKVKSSTESADPICPVQKKKKLWKTHFLNRRRRTSKCFTYESEDDMKTLLVMGGRRTVVPTLASTKTTLRWVAVLLLIHAVAGLVIWETPQRSVTGKRRSCVTPGPTARCSAASKGPALRYFTLHHYNCLCKNRRLRGSLPSEFQGVCRINVP